MNKRLTLLLATLAALLLSPVASAQSAQIGKALHLVNCENAGCHTGTPPRINNNAQSAANNPTVIRNAIRRNTGGMGYLNSLVSDIDLADIAKYIASSGPLPALADADRVLNWAEWKLQTLLLPRASDQTIATFTVRQYTQPNLYVGISAGRVYLYAPTSANVALQDLGPLSAFLGSASQDGF